MPDVTVTKQYLQSVHLVVKMMECCWGCSVGVVSCAWCTTNRKCNKNSTSL